MSNNPLFALTRPVHVADVHLVVRDLARVSDFYQKVMGLDVLEKNPSGQVLGVGGKPLLTLSTRTDAETAPPTAAGLFHTAFLVPNREELALWLAHAAHNNVQLQGASDHLVSEALYLADPEGNGIEIYRDRKQEEWNYQPDGTVDMATLRLDLQELYNSAPKATFAKMANGTAIGHVHLQVGDVPEAEAFYRDVMGLGLMARYPGASFFGSGKYHHHIAANVWNSRGASTRKANMTGLSGYTLKVNDEAEKQRILAALEKLEIATEREADGIAIRDPWGIGIKLSA
jgi:catechol 2,3-dioxygenase